MNIVICRSRFADNNIGERLILCSILGKLNTYPDTKITVLSNTPELTKKIHGIPVADCSLLNYYQAISAIRSSDLVLWCGGNMLQEQFSYLHIPYAAKDILLAKILGKKVFVYGVEVGPIVSRMGKFLARMILRNTDIITVRNTQSYQEANALGAKNHQLLLTEDAVFSISTEGLLDKNFLLEKFNLSGKKPMVGICPRILFERRRSYLPFRFRMRFGLLSDDFYHKQQQVKDFMSRISRFLMDESNVQVIFLPMDISDEAYCDEIIEAAGKDCIKITLSSMDLREVTSLFSIMDLVISMRLHGLILASCFAIPVISISGVTKNVNFLSKLGCEENSIDIEDLSIGKFKEVFNHLWPNLSICKQKMQTILTAMRREEEKNFIILRDFLKRIFSSTNDKR